MAADDIACNGVYAQVSTARCPEKLHENPVLRIRYATRFILWGNMPAVHKEGSLRIVEIPHLKFGLQHI